MTTTTTLYRFFDLDGRLLYDPGGCVPEYDMPGLGPVVPLWSWFYLLHDVPLDEILRFREAAAREEDA